MKKSNFVKFLQFFFISANFNAIFKIWFVFFDWLFFWKWYAVINNRAIFKWLNVIFQKIATNFLFRLNRIVCDNFHFSFCIESNHEIVHSDVDQMIILENILIRLKYLFVVINTAFIFIRKATELQWNQSLLYEKIMSWFWSKLIVRTKRVLSFVLLNIVYNDEYSVSIEWKNVWYKSRQSLWHKLDEIRSDDFDHKLFEICFFFSFHDMQNRKFFFNKI